MITPDKDDDLYKLVFNKFAEAIAALVDAVAKSECVSRTL